jgi:elongation factor G
MVVAPSHPKARTVALIGRSGVGKTTLLEALVVATGGLDKPGSVVDGTALCGNDPEERRHQTSLGIAMAPIWLGDDKLTLLDTPGFIDFHGEVERALDVADVAVLVVNAVGDLPFDFAAIWKLALEAAVPVVVFVNGLDAPRANYEATLTALEGVIGSVLAPIEMPIGAGSEFRGVLDLLANEALTYDTSGGHHGPIPEELAALESRLRASLLEAIVVGDDTLTERYLDGDEPDMLELEPVLSTLMVEGRIVPVTCGSALRGFGVDRLATLLDEIAVGRPIPALLDGEPVLLDRDPSGEAIARAFKVIVDPYLGRIVVMEVVSGTITPDIVLTCARTRSDERLHGLHHLMGAKLVAVERAVAGDVIAVPKLNDVVVGDYLAKSTTGLRSVPGHKPIPAVSVALVGSSRDDDDKIATSLHRLAEEDPSLNVHYDPVSRRLVIDVMGDTHLQVTLERLKRRFNLEVLTEVPSVQMYETIRAARDVEGRLKKQTGGHGQFAVVNLKVEPLEPTQPFEFVDAVVGGSVPRQYIGAVRSGVEKAMAHGGPLGHQVVGLRVTLYDGKSHAVDSSEAAFETAASIGLRQALEESGTIVLERIMEVTAEVPTEYLGEVLNDLSGRRGRVIGTDQDVETVVRVVAHVPEGELYRYGLDLRSVTAGRGRASIEEHHLSEAPRTVSSR